VGVNVAEAIALAETPLAVALKVAGVAKEAPLYETLRFTASAGELRVVFERVVTLVVSESVSVIGFSKGALPIMAALLASKKLTVSESKYGTPVGGVGFARLRLIDATTPSRTSWTVLAVPAAIVALVVFCESTGPVPVVD
jgi:hypothetical protein